MSIVGNKDLVRRVVDEFINGNRPEVANELFSEDFVNHNPSFGVEPDREGLKKMIGLFRQAFPDYRLIVEEVVSEMDKVAVLMRSTGTHRGEILGIKPTGNKVEFQTMSMVRIKNDKIVERWNITNGLEVLKMMGVM